MPLIPLSQIPKREAIEAIKKTFKEIEKLMKDIFTNDLLRIRSLNRNLEEVKKAEIELRRRGVLFPSRVFLVFFGGDNLQSMISDWFLAISEKALKTPMSCCSILGLKKGDESVSAEVSAENLVDCVRSIIRSKVLSKSFEKYPPELNVFGSQDHLDHVKFVSFYKEFISICEGYFDEENPNWLKDGIIFKALKKYPQEVRQNWHAIWPFIGIEMDLLESLEKYPQEAKELALSTLESLDYVKFISTCEDYLNNEDYEYHENCEYHGPDGG